MSRDSPSFDDLDPFEKAAFEATFAFGGDLPFNRPEFDKYRVEGNRSFPTGYAIPSPDLSWDSIKLHEARVREELNMTGVWRGAIRRGRLASKADRRVIVGPSDEDIEALSHNIYHGWCLAKSQCFGIGLYTADPLAINPKLRYGLVLDYLTRFNAVILATIREQIMESTDAMRGLHERYGLDPIRISNEHGVNPDVLGPYLIRLGVMEPPR